MSSRAKERNPDMRFLFLSKVPVNEPPPDSPTGLPVYRVFLHISQITYKKFP
jgi:hypothetical protein